MDDGYKYQKGLYLCTESYSFAENVFLKEMLIKKFKLDVSIHKHSNGHRIYISSKSKDKLISLVKPYIINPFLYKIE